MNHGDRASDDRLRQAAQLLRSARRVVVFSGAGMSAESGIPTFRDAGGVWSRFDPEQFATLSGIMTAAATRPGRLAEFLLALLEPIARAEPNPGHRSLARLENHREVTIVTQNVDGLHQAAGSGTVHEVHGSMFDVVTMSGGPLRTVTREELQGVVAALRRLPVDAVSLDELAAAVEPIMALAAAEPYRPGIVLFGEAMSEPAWSHALAAAQQCDLMLTVGTSAEVYPAALLPLEAQSAGARMITIDPAHGGQDLWLRGTAGEVLPRLVDAAFATA